MRPTPRGDSGREGSGGVQARVQGRVGRVTGVAVCSLVVAVVASLANSAPSRAAMATAKSGPGTCHVLADPDELFATISDTGPAVPCSQPHQTETLWVSQVTGPLAAAKRRPDPELLHAMLDRTCNDYWRVRAYLGADAYDNHWGVTMVLKVPTPAEWAKGDRTMRCDAAGMSGLDGPQLTDTLRGILSRKDSAAFRRCVLPKEVVDCDGPHSEEAMSPNVILPAGPWPGRTAVDAMARSACKPVAADYLGAPIATRPDLVITVIAPTQQQWEAGERSADCLLAMANGDLTTGTLRGGLR